MMIWEKLITNHLEKKTNLNQRSQQWDRFPFIFELVQRTSFFLFHKVAESQSRRDSLNFYFIYSRRVADGSKNQGKRIADAAAVAKSQKIISSYLLSSSTMLY